MCAACIEKVTPVLDEAVGKDQWSVNTSDPKKILTVTADAVNENQLIQALEKVGYKAEKLT